jgi:hypothetical protein
MPLTPQQKQLLHEVHMKNRSPADLLDHGFTQKDIAEEFGAASPESKEFQLLVRSRAHQLGLADLLAVKEEFLQAAADYYQHRTAKRAFKKGLRKATLDKVRKDLLRREKQLEKKTTKTKADASRLEELKKLKAKLAEHEKQKLLDQAAYDRARKKFVDLVDARIEYLEGQLKFARPAIDRPLAELDRLRERQRKLIRAANEEFCERWIADPKWATPPDPALVNAAAYAHRNLLLGPGTLTDAALARVPHPYEQTDSQQSDYDRLKPIQRLEVLDRQRELLCYQVDVIRGELRQLRQMRRLVAHSAAMWEFVEDIAKWVPRLQLLAESVTEFRRPVEVLAGAAPGPLSQRNRSTGSRDFTLELGVGYGIEKDIATVDFGLSVVLSGSLGLQDDRRLKANLSLQLVPSFTAALDTPVLAFEFAATMGFTISSQTYAFVDERHFAYYMAFRIANLLIFRDRFTKYGRSALHQHVGLYSPELKALLKKMIGDGGVQEMETYLTNSPVIKATLLQNWKPDLGFSASASLGLHDSALGSAATSVDVGGGVSASASLSHETLFERSQLVLPANGEQPYLLASRRKGKSWSYSVGVDAHLSSWVKGALEVNLSKIDNDANPDNNGTYLTITIKAEPFGLLPGLLPTFAPADGDPKFFQPAGNAAAGRAAPAKGVDLAAIRDSIVAALKVAANSLESIASDATQNWSLALGQYVEVEHTTERSLVIACQVESVSPLQVSVMYIRWLYTTGTSLSVSGAAETPYGDVALSGSAAWSKSVGLQEWLGPATMAYLQPAFNGYRLRPNGRQQWQALLDAHPRGLRAIFRNIGKNTGKDELQIRSDVKGYEEQVKEYQHIWKDRPYWDEKQDAGTGSTSFVKLCEAKRGALKQPLEPGKVGRLKRRFRRIPGGTLAELDTLKQELTTLLWRREQVSDHLEALKSPWQQRRTYLEQASGSLLFKLRWDDRSHCYRVVKPPQLKRSQGSRYQAAADIYLNPGLLNATTLRPFYEEGFDVYVRVVTRRKHPLPGGSKHNTLFTLRLRQPHGADVLERAYRALIAQVTAAAKPDTERLLALVRLHPKLEDHTIRWILQQEARGRQADAARAAAKHMTSQQKAAAKAAAKASPPPSADDVQRKALDEAVKLFDEWLLNPTAPGSPGAAQDDCAVLALDSVKAAFVGYRVSG